MSERDQSAELQALRGQLAELTRRVYHLEQLLSLRAESFSAPPAPLQSEPPHTVTPEPVSRAAGLASPPLAPPPAAAPVAAAAKPRPHDVSLESRIGGQWLNRIGIIAVLVGLSYFLKLAFENNWIGPATQVLIGIAAGIGILFWSERFRSKGYPGFAYSLKAVAIGALYLSLWAASQYYHLVSPTVTFFGMVLVTLTSAALSLRQNAELLAAFALVGGFLTPVLISTGQNHEFALFCYIALLDLGTVWIVSVRRWRRLLLGSFAGTVVLFAAWAVTYYGEAQLTPTLLFATFFFLLFAVTPFVPAERLSPNATAALALCNAAAYFTAADLMLFDRHRGELAWLTLAVAFFFFAVSRVLEQRKLTPYAPVHLALAVGFLSLAIPLKLHGPWIALGWLVEAGALFWAAHRGRSSLLRLLGLGSLTLGIVRLVGFDSQAHQTLLFNARFALYLVAIAALALLARFAMLEGGEENKTWAAGAILGLNVLALIALHFEVIDYFRPADAQVLSDAAWRSLHIARDFTYSAVWILYGSALMLVGFWKHSAFLRWQAIALFVLTAAKVFFYDISALERGYRIVAFIALGAVLLAVSFFYQRSRMKTAG